MTITTDDILVKLSQISSQFSSLTILIGGANDFVSRSPDKEKAKKISSLSMNCATLAAETAGREFLKIRALVSAGKMVEAEREIQPFATSLKNRIGKMLKYVSEMHNLVSTLIVDQKDVKSRTDYISRLKNFIDFAGTGFNVLIDELTDIIWDYQDEQKKSNAA